MRASELAASLLKQLLLTPKQLFRRHVDGLEALGLWLLVKIALVFLVHFIHAFNKLIKSKLIQGLQNMLRSNCLFVFLVTDFIRFGSNQVNKLHTTVCN